MNEATAKEKWCPFSRSWTSEGGVNRDLDGSIRAGDCCVGAACMAWRRRKPNSTEGYCGLVGTPWVTP